MNYRTTCPHCLSVFRLGPDQLDAAQGWVQCSVCGTAFDARPSLLMEDGSPLPQPEPELIEPAAPPEPGPSAEPEIETAATPDTVDEAPLAVPLPEKHAAVADTPRGIVERETSFDLDSIILIDPEIPVPEDPGPLPQIRTASAYPPEPATTVRRPDVAAAEPAPAARIEYAAPMPGKGRIPSARRRLNPWVGTVASLLLLITLLAQITYFLRDTLASRLPQSRPALEQACALLGCTLSLPQNLVLLQIVGSDLQTEAPARGTPVGAPLLRSDPSAASGHLKLTLTLGNRASHAQAWPVLVLTLNDQHNRPLARRSFAPSEYLGDARRIAEGIPARSEQPLNLPLTVRDLTPMGFNLQLTY